MPPAYPDITKSEYRSRISRAQALMKKEGMDAMLIASAVNIYYFTGFDSLMLFPPESDQLKAMVIRNEGEPVVAMAGPKRAFEDTCWASDLRQIGRPYETEAPKLFRSIWKELKLKGARIGAEIGYSGDKVEGIPGKIFLELLEQTKFVDATPLIDNVRLIKSEEELRRVRESGKSADRAFQRLVPEIKVGVTERFIGQRLAGYMCLEGADRPYYTLVRSAERYYNGLNMVLPYSRKIQRGDYIKIEYAADYRHYATEAKSLVLVGARPKTAERDHYLTLVEAVKQGAKAAKSGATAADVFAAEKKVLDEAGLKVPADRIPMGFGHGSALDAHEPPRLGPRDKTVLRPGMVVVVEPGGVPNAQGLYRYMSACNTVIVGRTAGERLPPLSEDIVTV